MNPLASSQNEKNRPKVNWFYTIHLLVVFGLALIGLPMVTPAAFIAFLLFYVGTVLGVTVGFHRYFTHRSFKVTKPVERGLAILGTLAAQGGVFKWVAQHRMHHAFVEGQNDPHSASEGFWHSHVGWLIRMNPDLIQRQTLLPFARDIAADPFLMKLSTFKMEVGLLLLSFGALWLAFGIEVAMWGVFVRLACVYTVTWLVNSYCHKFGYRNYETKDLSKNSILIGILAMGEGYHNNHHAHPHVAIQGHKWWELDLSGIVIRCLESIGWAYGVKHLRCEEDRKEAHVSSEGTHYAN